MKDHNTNFIYNQVNSREIYSDPAYQRTLDSNRVKRIVSEFNPDLVNPVKVSNRDGKYYVFDGQHTLAALKMRNINQDLLVPCKIYSGLTQQEEAKLFAEQNGISRAVDSSTKMKARLMAGDAEIKELHETITGLGIKFDFSKGSAPCKIIACSSAYKLFKKLSLSEFKEVLTIIKQAWGTSPEGFSKEILLGLGIFYNTYKGNITIAKAVVQFSKVSPREIIREGNASSNAGDIRFARQMLAAYNKGLRVGRLDGNLL